MSSAEPATDRGTIVLLGADGMLGRAWSQRFRVIGQPFRALSFPQIDLADPSSVAALDLRGASWVINCAAWTDVDGAEAHEEQATAINGDGVGWLAEACRAAGVPLVHYSTDYVFAGDATSPYAVDERHAPLNAYGRGKARGEALLWAADVSHLLLRTSWLYAPWGKNFVLTMMRLGASKPQLRVVADQRGRPTSAQYLCAVSWALMQRGERGTFHVTDGGECTWCEFAQEIVRRVDPSCRVDPCTTDEFPRPAVRPAYSVLDLDPTERVVGALADWRDNLAHVMGQVAGPTE